MSAYHVMLTHFPIALWSTAALIILYRAFSSSPLAQSADRVLAPMIFIGTAVGVLAFAVGLSVWPVEAFTSSPLARNHILLASWALSYWALLGLLRWRAGDAVWQGLWRWVMLGLAGLGMGLQTITGTLGGYLAGNPSAVSEVLRRLGWEVFTTFYLPNWMLGALVVAAIALVVLGFFGRPRAVSTKERVAHAAA
jgi:hypothetical protein